MARKKKSKIGRNQLPKAITRWRELYVEQDPFIRIKNAYTISVEANKMKTEFTRKEIHAAVNTVVGLPDSRNATVRGNELLRLALAFQMPEIEKACQNYGHGASLSHLMILTRVADDGMRCRLLEQSITNGWSMRVLCERITGKSEVKVTLRPTRLAKSAQRSADHLVELLDQVISGNLAAKTESVKPKDLSTCQEALSSCLRSLAKLEHRLEEAKSSLERTRDAVRLRRRR